MDMFYYTEWQHKIYMYLSYRKERQNSAVANPEVEKLWVLDKMKKKKKKHEFFVYSSHMLVFFAGLLHAVFESCYLVSVGLLKPLSGCFKF